MCHVAPNFEHKKINRDPFLQKELLKFYHHQQLVHVHTVLYFSSLFLIKKIELYNARQHSSFAVTQCSWFLSISLVELLLWSIPFFIDNFFLKFFLSIFLLYFLLFSGFFLLHYWSHYFVVSLSPRVILIITYLNGWELEVCVETVIFYLVFRLL